MHNSCKKNLKLNEKQMENTLWLIRLVNTYKAFTLKVRWITISNSFQGVRPGFPSIFAKIKTARVAENFFGYRAEFE